MKKATVPVLFLLVLLSARANTYYSTNNSSPNSTSSWHTNRNGTGSTPTNFNGAGDIFIVQSGHTMVTTANWNVGGNNAQIIVETGATLQANQKITIDVFELDGTATYIHNDNSSAFPGSNTVNLAPTSTVEINDWNGSTKLPGSVNWGNLIIDMPGYNSNMNQAGDLNSIAGDFIIRSTGNAGKEFRLAAGQDFTLTIGGNLILEGGTLEASSNSNTNATQLIIINGSFIQSGGTFVRSNINSNVLQIQFNGTNSGFTKTGGTLSAGYMSWKVNTSKKLTLNNDLPISASRSITVDGVLDLGTKSITGSGSFTVSASGKLISSHTSGLAGNLTLTGGTTFTNGASYEFNGATTTAFPSSMSSVVATNLTIGADVTINKNATVSGLFTLNSGIASIPAGNTVTISSGNAVAGSGFGNSRHVATLVNTSTGAKGFLRIQNYTGATVIPVGNGTYYMPVTLTAPGTNDFSICVFNGITSNGQPDGTAFTTSQKKTVVDAVWQVNRNSGSGNCTLQLQWPSALEGSLFQNVAGNQIGIAHYGSYWEMAIGTGDQVANTATRTPVSSFSPFGVGYAGVILPLTMADMKATPSDAGTRIEWTSYSEHDIDHYEVERSSDGKNFSDIMNVPATGSGSSTKNYSIVDHIAPAGIVFYRIKGITVDGRYGYSAIVRVNPASNVHTELRLYPNPVVDNNVNIELTGLPRGTYDLRIINQMGKIVFRKSLDHNGGNVTEQLHLPVLFAAGLYTLSVSDNNQLKLARTFILQ